MTPDVAQYAKGQQRRGLAGYTALLEVTRELTGLPPADDLSVSSLVRDAQIPASLPRRFEHELTQLGSTAYACLNEAMAQFFVAACVDEDGEAARHWLHEAAEAQRLQHHIQLLFGRTESGFAEQYNLEATDSHPPSPLQLVACVVLETPSPNWVANYDGLRMERDFRTLPENTSGQQVPQWLHAVRALSLRDHALAEVTLRHGQALDQRANKGSRLDAYLHAIARSAHEILTGGDPSAALVSQANAYRAFLVVPHNTFTWMRWIDRHAAALSIDLQALFLHHCPNLPPAVVEAAAAYVPRCLRKT